MVIILSNSVIDGSDTGKNPLVVTKASPSAYNKIDTRIPMHSQQDVNQESSHSEASWVFGLGLSGVTKLDEPRELN